MNMNNKNEKDGKQTDTALEVLCRCHLIPDMEPEQIRREILPLGHLRHYGPGSQIFLKQDAVDWIGILLDGRVRLLQLFENGEESLIDLLGPPQVLAADLAFTRTRRSIYYAEAAEEVLLFRMPVTVLTEPGSLRPEVRTEMISRLLRIVSHDNMKRAYHLSILSQSGLRSRILTYLTMQAEKRGTRELTIPFSREEMARYLCVNRSALSHELAGMQREGLIRFRKNRFTLLTPAPDPGQE